LIHSIYLLLYQVSCLYIILTIFVNLFRPFSLIVCWFFLPPLDLLQRGRRSGDFRSAVVFVRFFSASKYVRYQRISINQSFPVLYLCKRHCPFTYTQRPWPINLQIKWCSLVFTLLCYTSFIFHNHSREESIYYIILSRRRYAVAPLVFLDNHPIRSLSPWHTWVLYLKFRWVPHFQYLFCHVSRWSNFLQSTAGTRLATTLLPFF